MHKRLLSISIVSVASLGAASPADPVVTWVLNRSNFAVAVKDEFGPRIAGVLPGERRFGAEDGFAIPGLRPGQVFKVFDGLDAVIDENGDVTTSGGTLIEQAAQMVLGGWKGEAWLDQRHNNGDREWDVVFSEATSGNEALLEGPVR